MERTISPKVLAKAEALLQKEEEKMEKVRANLAKYPHANAETLRMDEGAGKFSVEITCTLCGAKGRRVYTSDLFQVTTCEGCSSKAKAAKKAEKKAELEAAKEILRERKAAKTE